MFTNIRTFHIAKINLFAIKDRFSMQNGVLIAIKKGFSLQKVVLIAIKEGISLQKVILIAIKKGFSLQKVVLIAIKDVFSLQKVILIAINEVFSLQKVVLIAIKNMFLLQNSVLIAIKIMQTQGPPAERFARSGHYTERSEVRCSALPANVSTGGPCAICATLFVTVNAREALMKIIGYEWKRESH